MDELHDSPYDDSIPRNGLLQYKYRGTDPHHPDNVGLRTLMQLRIPLIYLYGVSKGRYVPTWPVYIIADDPGKLTFEVAVDSMDTLGQPDSTAIEDDGSEIRRKYITSAVRTRLHQSTFRERVLRAYRNQCALCRLRHRELLEAAHIRPDRDEGGEPVVSNGLSLCKIHHAAFDKYILGIRPDCVVEIRQDILDEIDGPMLRFGLQEMHGAKLHIPASVKLQPDREALTERYELFLAR